MKGLRQKKNREDYKVGRKGFVTRIIMMLSVVCTVWFAKMEVQAEEYVPYEGASYSLTYRVEEGSVKISGFKGTASGELVIPNEIDGKVVTVIGGSAFERCSGFSGELNFVTVVV